MMKPEEAWQAALGELQLQMTKATFDTWLKQTYVITYEDGTFIVGVQNGYAKDWLENRLVGTIQRTLSAILDRSVEIRFLVQSPDPTSKEPVVLLESNDGRAAIRPSNGGLQCSLRSQYTFDQFIIGSSNRLAHAASLAVAESPAEAYNPLFLYGGVGLGKTHLLQAIAHYALAQGFQVLYVTSEAFTNDLINAIRSKSKSMDDFRDCYRTADFLLVDDIQFIAGKERTQEEFFHTFNALHSAGRQIAMSSDRPPQAIPTLEERLVSRFEWGLIADIQPPDLETRIAILRFKSERQNARVPSEVIDFIARQMPNNIRELEGGLNRVLAHASLMRVPVTLALARQALHKLVARQEELELGDILSAVARHFKVSEEDLLGRSRRKQIALARQMVMYLAREEMSTSLPKIGQALGGRDHSTVLHGYDKIATQIETDASLRRDVMAIRERLYREKA